MSLQHKRHNSHFFLLHETSYTKHSVTLHKDRLQDIMVNDIKGVKKSENIHIHEAGT